MALTQTCRVLHTFGSADYIWRQIPVDLPLEIAPHVDRRSLSGSQMKSIFVSALRLEDNWRRPQSRIRKVSRNDVQGPPVSAMQFIGKSWLVTMSRASYGNLFKLSVWGIQEGMARVAASTDVPYGSKFAAALKPGCPEAIVAVIVGPSRIGTVCVRQGK